jgi:uncharacterized protein with von Willebrand factor type A (vWA) domain
MIELTEAAILRETVLFCRDLREAGLPVTPAEAIDASAALNIVDRDDRDEVFQSLRSILTSRAEDFPVFQALFDDFWNRLLSKPPARRERIPRKKTERRNLARESQLDQTRKNLAFFLENWNATASRSSEEAALPLASRIESTGRKDFSAFGPDGVEEVSRLSKRIARRLAKARSRRWVPLRRGKRIDLRRSLRQSIKSGGEMIELSFKQRKLKKTRLVVICDVSGSMDLYSRLLLQFVYGLQNSFARVESFIFSTALKRITSQLKNKSYGEALDRLASEVSGWSGGTLIGPSIDEFNQTWGGLVDRRTIVIILSDGWDTAEPEVLSRSLAIVSRRAGRLIWLNPLLAGPMYQPLTRGMRAALDHIDVFADLSDLASLRALERHLTL